MAADNIETITCSRFPLMHKCGHSFDGFLKISGTHYRISAFLPQYPSLHGIQINMDARLFEFERSVTDCASTFSNISELFNYISELVKNTKEDRVVTSVKCMNRWKTFRNIYSEMNQIGDCVKPVDDDFTLFAFEMTDSKFVTHKAVVKITANYPADFIDITSIDLPIQLHSDQNPFKWITTLHQFHEKFSELVAGFQFFWETMELLDNNCWILEPQHASLKDTTRRIRIADDVSIMLNINPFNPRHLPEITFLGYASSVQGFRTKLEANLLNNKWDPQTDVLENLLTVLDLITFPEKPDDVDVDAGPRNLVAEGECAICFEVDVNGQLPAIVCDDICRALFHELCLYTQLRTDHSNKPFFGRIQGECPSCDRPISCPVPKEV